jgi:hypothetical protein
MIQHTQFDTVYHEHFSYLSLYSANRILTAADLRIWDVEQLSTHGGSLRIYACHTDANLKKTERPDAILEEERALGLQNLEVYQNFQRRADKIKEDLRNFLIEQKRLGKQVVAYGAAAKGNTLLNYAGINSDLIPFVYDAAKAKQGKYMPGSHIPILAPDSLKNIDPAYILILPWNIAPEIIDENKTIAIKGAKFVTAIPYLTII